MSIDNKSNNWAVFFQKVIVIVLIFGGIYFVLDKAGDETRKILHPNITREEVTEIVASQLEKTVLDEKYVVLTQDLTVEISRDVDKYIFDLIYWGNATMKIKYIGNKVQYYVPLSEINAQNIEYFPETRTVRINSPKAVIDKEMVFIQSDPDKVLKEENGSWFPYGPQLEDLQNSIQKEVKEKTIAEGSHYLIESQAQQVARQKLQMLFEKVLTKFLSEESINLEVMMP